VILYWSALESHQRALPCSLPFLLRTSLPINHCPDHWSAVSCYLIIKLTLVLPEPV